MKKIILIAAVIVAGASFTAHAYDWKDLLKGAAGNKSEQTDEQTETTADSNASSSNSLISGLIGFVQDATGLNKITEQDLVGTWNYVEPAVSFQSDNLLNKAGGAAAATVVVDKLKPYYEKIGLQHYSVTFNEDKTFEMGVGKIKVKGVYAKNEDNTFALEVQVMGKTIKTITSYITRSGSGMSMTFDASSLITLVNTVSSLTGNSTLKGLSSLLNSYDGMTVGFKLAKGAN